MDCLERIRTRGVTGRYLVSIAISGCNVYGYIYSDRFGLFTIICRTAFNSDSVEEQNEYVIKRFVPVVQINITVSMSGVYDVALCSKSLTCQIIKVKKDDSAKQELFNREIEFKKGIVLKLLDKLIDCLERGSSVLVLNDILSEVE